jgi:hypothetical protein
MLEGSGIVIRLQKLSQQPDEPPRSKSVNTALSSAFTLSQIQCHLYSRRTFTLSLAVRGKTALPHDFAKITEFW